MVDVGSLGDRCVGAAERGRHELRRRPPAARAIDVAPWSPCGITRGSSEQADPGDLLGGPVLPRLARRRVREQRRTRQPALGN
jgi:hypothetical protein